MELVSCPDCGCGRPAEVLDRWDFASTHGPVPHAKTRCLAAHVFTVPCLEQFGWPNRHSWPARAYRFLCFLHRFVDQPVAGINQPASAAGPGQAAHAAAGLPCK